MKTKIETLKTAIQNKLGSHCIGVLDFVDEHDQMAFVTDEPDRGEDHKAEWYDVNRECISETGLRRISVLPYTTNGFIMYVLAGFRRAAALSAA